MRIRWTRWILQPTVTLPGAPGHQVEHLRVTLGMHSGYEGVGTEYAGYPMGWIDILKLYPIALSIYLASVLGFSNPNSLALAPARIIAEL